MLEKPGNKREEEEGEERGEVFFNFFSFLSFFFLSFSETELPRKYLVKVHGRVSSLLLFPSLSFFPHSPFLFPLSLLSPSSQLEHRRLRRLKNGISIDGFFYKGMSVSVAGLLSSYLSLSLSLSLSFSLSFFLSLSLSLYLAI